MIKNLEIKEKLSLGLKNHKKNNLKAAESLYKEILKINSNHFETNYLLGNLYLQKSNFTIATSLFDK